MFRKGGIVVNVLAVITAILIFAGMALPLTSVDAANYEYNFHYWSFDGSGDDASGKLDLSADSPEFAEGRHGKALDTENGDAMRTKKLTEKTTAGFTMGAWIKLSSGATEWNIIMSKGNTADAQQDRVQIHVGHASAANNGGMLLTYSPATAAQLSNENDGKPISYDTWYQITVTYNLSVLRMYINGELFAEREAHYDLKEALGNMNTITVGALNHDGSTFRFCGLIDDAFYANFAMKEADVKAAFDSPEKLKGFADGSIAITPDVPGGTATEEPANATPEAGEQETAQPETGKGPIYFWPFDGSTNDISHNEMNIDTEDVNEGYTDGKVGKAITVVEPLSSDYLPADTDLSAFTIAFWVKWEENDNGAYTAPIAFAGKETDHHFELYFRVDENTGGLSFYETRTGWNLENIANVERGEYTHIAAVSGENGFRIFLNGEVIYEAARPVNTSGLGTTDDFITLGGLNDLTLKCMGEYDELLIAAYEMPDEFITKLYSDPAGARADIEKLVESNYPEGYTPPEKTPEPTEAPTKEPTPEATEPEETPTPDNSEPTATPEPEEPTATPEGQKKGCGGTLSFGAAAAVALAFVIFAKKRER